MTDNYRVTAPYITLRSKSETGGDVVLGYYAGALVPETVDLQDLARHIRKGMVEKLEAVKEDKPLPRAADSKIGVKTATAG